MLNGYSIKKNYSNVTAVDKINISITPGLCSILIGPSGSGKSTLIRLLSLIEKPDEGKVQIDDEYWTFPDNKFEETTIWPKVTVVFQQLFLWPHITLKENILLPLKFRKYNQGHLDELIEVFNMREFIERYPNEVSQGQRQRVAIVRALMLNPKYILFDEITSALDIEQARIILNHIEKLRNQGIGVLLVTHQLEYVKKILQKNEGDKFYFLDKGKVNVSGGIDEFENPINPRFMQFLSMK